MVQEKRYPYHNLMATRARKGDDDLDGRLMMLILRQRKITNVEQLGGRTTSELRTPMDSTSTSVF